MKWTWYRAILKDHSLVPVGTCMGKRADMILLERISAVLIAGFAAWTIFAHALTFSACSFETLRKWSWLGLLMAVVAAGVVTKLGSRKGSMAVDGSSEASYDKKTAIGSIAGALVLIVVYRWTASYWVFWVLVIAYLGTARWVLGAGPVHASRASVESGLNPAVLIASGCVVAYVMTRTGINLDDPFQVNLIIGLLEHPSWPMLRFDTMHRVMDLPIMTSAYLSLSLEPLQAILVDRVGVKISTLRHLVFPPLAASIGIVYLYLFLQAVTPRWAGPALLTFAAVVLVYAMGFRSLGSFYWEYLAAGKQILVAMIVPALLWYTSRWMALGNMRDGAMLGAASVAAAGLTPNGIFVAPLTVGLLAMAHFTADRAVLKRIILASIFVAYPLGIGLIILLTTNVTPSEVLDVAEIEQDLRGVLGWDWRFWFVAPLLLSAWSVLPTSSSRRLILSWTLIFFLTLANPALDVFWAHYLTGNLNWRLFWTFPILLLIAVALHGSVGLFAARRWVHWVVPVSVVAGSMASGISTLAPGQWHEFGLPGDRVPMPEYEIAKVLRDNLSPADGVLAPNTISAYLTTLSRHPRPVITRPLYLIHLKKHLSTPDLVERALLYALVAPDQAAGGEFQNLARHIEQLGGTVSLDEREIILENFGKILDQRAIRAVAYRQDNEFASQLDRVLAAEGFRNTPQATYQVWIKRP